MKKVNIIDLDNVYKDIIKNVIRIKEEYMNLKNIN